MQVEEWELSQSLVSDSQGVRAACIVPTKKSSNDDDSDNNTDVVIDSFNIISGNQGGGLCEFSIPTGSIYPITYQHNHGIASMISNDKYYITGCKDGMIRIFNSITNELMTTLKGHEKPVTSLAFVKNVTNEEFLVSGSWDQTAKVWNINTHALIATLTGHENSTCVIGLESSSSSENDNNIVRIATGSAGIAQNNTITNHSIRIWTINIVTGETNCINTVSNDHDGPIRSITTLPSKNIVSCSNDGTVKLRSIQTGQCISTLTFLQQQEQQHPPMLLSVTATGETSSTLVASAEDGHVIVWDLLDETGKGPQIILHPSCVWNVVSLPNGDFATCCQDGYIRIFTRSTERIASTIEKENFLQLVQDAHSKKSTGPTKEEIAKLPLWEHSTSHSGKSEGQVQVFNKGGIAIAAQWSMVSQTWIEVGQVMGSKNNNNNDDGGTGSGTINGVSYDHILPIEVDQTGGTVAKLQIGYNTGENPFVAAQRFIDEHMLPQYHLNDIADYIQQRIGHQTPTIGGGSDGDTTMTMASTTSATPTTATTGIPMVSYIYIPMKQYKSFDLSNKNTKGTMDKMKTKIIEFNKLNEQQINNLTNLINILIETSHYHSSKISNNELSIIIDMLQILPINEVFPALDLARLTIRHPDATTSSSSNNNNTYWTTIIEKAISLCEQQQQNDIAIPMLSLRLFVNALRCTTESSSIINTIINTYLDKIILCCEKFILSKNKNVRLSVATLLYNISFYLYSNTQQQRPEIATQIVTICNTIFDSKLYESEALTRCLIALGTITLINKEAKQVAKSLYVISKVEMVASPHGDIAKAVAKEVYNVLV